MASACQPVHSVQICICACQPVQCTVCMNMHHAVAQRFFLSSTISPATPQSGCPLLIPLDKYANRCPFMLIFALGKYKYSNIFTWENLSWHPDNPSTSFNFFYSWCVIYEKWLVVMFHKVASSNERPAMGANWFYWSIFQTYLSRHFLQCACV